MPDDAGGIRFRDGWLDQGYTQIPNCVLRHPVLSPGAKTIYALLLSYAWSADHCWPGQKRLAEESASSERSVRTWLLELRTAQLLTIEQRGLTQTNVYWLESLADLAREDDCRTERQNLPIQAANPADQDRQTLPPKKTHGTRRKKEDHAGATPELATLWHAVLSDLAEQMVPGNYTRWLARTALLACADGAAVVGVPDQVSADQLSRRFDPLVRRALADACGEAVTVRYQVA